MSTFIQTLDHAWHTTNSLLCVGLDPEPTRFPGAYANRSDAIFDFCKRIVDATAPYASSFKPQIAYFAARPPAIARSPVRSTAKLNDRSSRWPRASIDMPLSAAPPGRFIALIG